MQKNKDTIKAQPTISHSKPESSINTNESKQKVDEKPKTTVSKPEEQQQSDGSANSNSTNSESPSTSSSPVLSDENVNKNEDEDWQEVKTKRNKKEVRKDETSRRSRNRPHRSNANDGHHQQGSTITADTRSERSVASVDGLEHTEEMTDSHVNKLIILTQTPKFNKTKSEDGKRGVRTKLDDEMEHVLRRYEEELWQNEGRRDSVSPFSIQSNSLISCLFLDNQSIHKSH